MRFWGVRGSIAVPGAQTQRYGGNTSCVELQLSGQGPLVIDAGTGIRALGQEIFSRPEREVTLLFTHFHLDHVFGFPFFAALFAPSFRVSVVAPTFTPEATRDRLGRYLNGVLHPLRVHELPAPIDYGSCRPGRSFERGEYRITPVQLNHPGGACGYVIEGSGKKVAHLTDTSPLSRPGEGLAGGGRPTGREQAVVNAIKRADYVAIDTMFSQEEYLEKMTWGHGYPEYAAALCREAEVRCLGLFHHAPDATDDDLDRLGDRWSAGLDGMRVVVAREGEDVDLSG
ncbi:MAG: MBL fold metallo-hydrolase [Deltaproteobacteria bacterium]|nr:MBL fold metallo-hydrolase [Deltaproteobacteria bacterium]